MRLLSFQSDDGPSFGALVEGRIVDLGKCMPEHESLRGLFEARALVRALDMAAEVSAEYRADAVEYLAPITDLKQILIATRGTSQVLPLPWTTLVGTRQPLELGVGVEAGLAVSAGFAVLMGEDAVNVDVAQAAERIAGITLVSVVEPGMVAMGPTLVTLDELAGSVELTTTVTLAESQSEIPTVGLTELVELVSHVSASVELAAGDALVLLHALPEPLPVLTPDTTTTITVSCEAIGTLSNELSIALGV